MSATDFPVKTSRLTTDPLLALLLALGLFARVAAAASAPGFIVAAPDRGFIGNEETRDAFAPLAQRFPAQLVFVTDERARPYFERAVAALRSREVDRVVVLPFYLSAAHPDFALLHRFAAASRETPIEFGRPFGESYLAVRALADRLAKVPENAARVVVAGEGARNDAQAEAMKADYRRLLDAAKDRFDFQQADVIITHENEDLKAPLATLAAGTTIVPFQLGAKYDGMMSQTAWLRYAAPDNTTVLDGDVTPHPAVTDWLLREAARYGPLDGKKIGVIVHAHGADFHWNEAMREASAFLADDFLVEYAFSMGDPDTLERAVRKLEARGANAVVIVRVFGMANSFLEGIARFIGADYESCGADRHGHAMHHGAPPPRLLTALPVATTGGLEDHPLFAKALLDRARSLSHDPKRETIILVAHGQGDDEENAAWMKLLASLRRQMLDDGGNAFRAIEFATWREDWPDKRKDAVAHLRELIEQAHADGGRAILIPARTTGQGSAREFIPDMDYELGSGFAPHPLFVQWLREQVAAGVQQIRAANPADCSSSGAGGEHHHQTMH